MLYTLSVLAFFLCACAALVSGDVVFTRSAAPPGWQLGSRADVGASVRLQFGLKQQNLDVLDAKFWAVSDPKSPEYQNFMTIEAISAIVAPKAEDVTLIKNWLFQHGVKETEIKSLAGDSLEVVTTVQVAENLFETQFYQYVNTKSKKTLLRQFGPLSVPSDVMDRLDLIDGVSQFPPPVNGRYGHRVNDNADNGVVAQSIWSLYNIGTQSATIPISSGLAEFQGETFSPSWLASYGPLAGITIAPLTANHIVGTNTGGGETEADLDIQMIASVNTVATNWFWIEDNDGWLWSFATHFFNTTDVPLVISIS
jgi:tripeptidyl-peptidase-1